MSGHAMWQERVRAWRRSGQTAPMFSQGKGFTPSALRYWAARLEKLARREPSPAVAMARVEQDGIPRIDNPARSKSCGRWAYALHEPALSTRAAA